MRSLKKKSACQLLVVLIVLIAGLWNASRNVQNLKMGLDLAGGVSIAYRTLDQNPSKEALQDVIYKLQKRVESYSTEAEVYLEGTNQINVDIPGAGDAKSISEELGAPGTLQFIDETGNVLLTGDMILDAQVGYRKNTATQTSEYVIELTLDEDGTHLFAEATKALLGETISIVYDGEIVSTPLIHTTVTGGTCYIENMGDAEEANRLARTIRIGSLPLELEEVRSTLIGAKLGVEAIGSSVDAGVVGVVIIILLMCVVYRMPGVAASIALLLYVALMLLAIRGFDMTLTLPGIAGIVLGIGMAVDANVIIFAGIREEMAADLSVKHAIRAGFVKARSAIWDGNLTTLIAAVILLWLGAGTMKGFAQTLALGIIISMFTALVVTKVVLLAFYEVGFQDVKYYGHIRKNRRLEIVGKRRYFAISGCFFSLGILAALFLGTGSEGQAFRVGLEFKGGTATTIFFEEELTLEQITKEVLPIVKECVGGGQAEAQMVSGTKEVVFKTRALTQTESEQLQKTLAKRLPMDTVMVRSDRISAIMSQEMRRDAMWSVVLAIIAMMLYIWFRFQDICVGISAMLALIHDVLAVLVIYAVLKLDVGNTFVACILAIVGYSVNATIVVFDRIREQWKKKRDRVGLKELVNQSIEQTWERSIYSSVTTLIMAVTLYLFGVAGIREFALPLMVGIVGGTYSSIFLVGTVWYWLHIKMKKSEG